MQVCAFCSLDALRVERLSRLVRRRRKREQKGRGCGGWGRAGPAAARPTARDQPLAIHPRPVPYPPHPFHTHARCIPDPPRLPSAKVQRGAADAWQVRGRARVPLQLFQDVHRQARHARDIGMLHICSSVEASPSLPKRGERFLARVQLPSHTAARRRRAPATASRPSLPARPHFACPTTCSAQPVFLFPPRLGQRASARRRSSK